MSLKLYEHWLITEGGWATTKTQGTVIKPLIIADCVKKTRIVAEEFIDKLKSN